MRTKTIMVTLIMCLFLSGCSKDDSITPNNSNTNTSTSVPNPSGVTVQCSGRTQAGARCKRRTTNTSGRCFQH